MLRFFYVRFPDQRNIDGKPFSYEPGIWHRILHQQVHCHELDRLGTREIIASAWLSEHPNTLNVLVRHDGTDAAAQMAVKSMFQTCVEVGIPANTEIQAPQSSNIIHFRMAA